jgi:Uma2 family endonuclease
MCYIEASSVNNRSCYMTQTQPQQALTAADLQELSQSDDTHLELIEGVLYPMPPAGGKHGSVTSILTMHVQYHVSQHNLGYVTAAETGYRLAEKTVLAPDIGFIRAERIPAELPDGFVPFAPDLAVEVMSPGNSASEMSRKVALFFQHGTRLIWVVHPNDRKVDVYHPADDGAKIQFLGMDDTLDGGDVLPGFSLAIRELFA